MFYSFVHSSHRFIICSFVRWFDVATARSRRRRRRACGRSRARSPFPRNQTTNFRDFSDLPIVAFVGLISLYFRFRFVCLSVATQMYILRSGTESPLTSSALRFAVDDAMFVDVRASICVHVFCCFSVSKSTTIVSQTGERVGFIYFIFFVSIRVFLHFICRFE